MTPDNNISKRWRKEFDLHFNEWLPGFSLGPDIKAFIQSLLDSQLNDLEGYVKKMSTVFGEGVIDKEEVLARIDQLRGT